MRIRTFFSALACTSLLIGYGARASAQQNPAGPSSGPLVLEPLRNSFVIAPDFKITKFDGQRSTLAGAYGGWVNDDHLLLGAGAYWLADGKNGRGLGYGGFVIGWTMMPEQTVSVGLKGLLGFGEATRSYGDIVVRPLPTPFDRFDQDQDRLSATTRTLRIRQDVFIAEPEVDVRIRLTDAIRLTLGGGYRAVNRAYNLNSGLYGATGSVSLQFKLR